MSQNQNLMQDLRCIFFYKQFLHKMALWPNDVMAEWTLITVKYMQINTQGHKRLKNRI